MPGSLMQGYTALVTGSNRGIGSATVAELARHGASVWACARTETREFAERCQALSRDFGVSVKPLYFDLRDSNAVRDAFRVIRADGRKLDVLVNCAGVVAPSTSFPMTSAESVLEVIDTNLVRQMEVTRYALRVMRDGGSIVNVSSIAARGEMPGQYGYSCSKGAVETWTRLLARELGPRHIRVNAVAPGFVDTDMGHAATGELRERIVASTVMGRMAQPPEIAGTIVALASDLTSYVTGQTLYVDGGGCSLNG